MNRILAVLAGAAMLPALAGCGTTGTKEPPAAVSPSAVDVCAMVPAAELAAAIGADPGKGVAEPGKVDGGQCTWKVSDTHTALAQFTRQPDVYLPDGVWERPDSASDVPGVTRGFAAAETHTVLVVKDGRGLLFTDIAFQDADQPAYAALAKAIAARL